MAVNKSRSGGIYININASTEGFNAALQKVNVDAGKIAQSISDSFSGALNADKVKSSLSGVTVEFAKIGHAAKALQADLSKHDKSFADITRALGQTGAAAQRLEGHFKSALQKKLVDDQVYALRSLQRQLGLTASETRALAQNMGMGDAAISAAFKAANRDATAFGSCLKGIAFQFGGMYLGAQKFKDYVVSISKTSIQLDSLQRSFNAISGSAADGADEMRFVRQEADRLGQDVFALSGNYRNLLAASKEAGISQDVLRKAFSAVGEQATVLGLSSESVNRIFSAMSQMVGKGVVSMEEMRQQLGEQLPTAFAAAARGMGITVSELIDRITNGQVKANEMFRALSVGFDNSGFAEAAGSARAEMERLGNAFTDIAGAIGNSGFLEGVADSAKALAESLKTEDMQENLRSLGKNLGNLASLLGTITKFVIENQNAFLLLGAAYITVKTSTLAVNPALSAATNAFQSQSAAILGAGRALSGFASVGKAAFMAIGGWTTVFMAAAGAVTYLATRETEAEKTTKLFETSLKGLKPELSGTADAARVAAENIAKMSELQIIAALPKLKKALEDQKKAWREAFTFDGVNEDGEEIPVLDNVSKQISALKKQYAEAAINVQTFNEKVTEIARANPHWTVYAQTLVETANKMNDNAAAVKAMEDKQGDLAVGIGKTGVAAQTAAQGTDKLAAAFSKLDAAQKLGTEEKAIEFLRGLTGSAKEAEQAAILLKKAKAEEAVQLLESAASANSDAVALKRAHAATAALAGGNDTLIDKLENEAAALQKHADAARALAAEARKKMADPNFDWTGGKASGASGVKQAQKNIIDYNAEIEKTQASVKSLQAQLATGQHDVFDRESIAIAGKYETTVANINKEFKKTVVGKKGVAKADAEQLRDEKLKEAELQKQLDLLKAQEKEQQRQAQLLQSQSQFYNELADLSGEYGLAIELQNRLIDEQAEKWHGVAGFSEHLVQRWQELKKLQLDRSPEAGITRAFQKYASEAQNLGKQTEEAFTSLFSGLDSNMRGMWDQLLEKGKVSLSSFKDLFRNFLADLAHMAITQPITVYIAGLLSGGNASLGGLPGSVAGLFSGRGSSSSLGGLLNYAGSAKTLYEWGGRAYDYATSGSSWFAPSYSPAADLADEVAANVYLSALREGATEAEALATSSEAAANAVSELGGTAATTAAQVSTFLGFLAAFGTLAKSVSSGRASTAMATGTGFAAGAVGGAAAGAAIGASGTSWSGPFAAFGAALGALIGSLIGGGGENQPAVRAWGTIGLTDMDVSDGTAMTAHNTLQEEGKYDFVDQGNSYAVVTRANKDYDDGLWEAAENFNTFLADIGKSVKDANSAVVDVLPDNIRQQWNDAIAAQGSIEFYEVMKGGGISQKNLEALGTNIQSQMEKKMVAAFQSMDFSDWEYAGKLNVDQGLLEETAAVKAIKAVEGVQGIDVLKTILGDSTLTEGLRGLYGYEGYSPWNAGGINKGEIQYNDMLRVLNESIAVWERVNAGLEYDESGMLVQKQPRYDEEGNVLLSNIEKIAEELNNLSGLEVIARLPSLLSEEAGMADLDMKSLLKPLAEWQDAVFESGKAGLDKMLKALTGMATMESIIESIENPVEPISQWVADAQAAVEQMNAHRAEYLDGLGWTEEVINETMTRYREAVTGSLMDQIDEILHPMSDLEAKTKEQVSTLDEWIKALKILEATEGQIAEIEKVRATIQEDLLGQARAMVTPATEMEAALANVNTQFDNIVASLETAGASLAQVTEAENLRIQALHNAAGALRQPFLDDLTLRSMTAAGLDTSETQQDSTFRNQLADAAGTFGKDSLEYKALLAVQEAERLKAAADKAKADLEETANALAELRGAAESASGSVESARLALVNELVASLDNAMNGIKQAVDAWVNATKSTYETAAKAYLSALQSEQSAWNTLAGRLNQTRSGLWTDSGLNSQPTVYGSAKAEMDAAYAAALGGDTDAAEKFAGLAKTFLDSSYAAQGDYSGYIKDFDAVQGMLGRLEKEAASRSDAMQSEIEVLQEQLGEQNKTNRTLEELKAAMDAALPEYQRALEEQAAAYAEHGFEMVASLEQQYRDAVAQWMDADKVLNDALLSGITSQLEIEGIRNAGKLDELKNALMKAQADSSSALADLAAAQARKDAAQATYDNDYKAASNASDKANELIKEAENAFSGVYGSKSPTAYALLQAKTDQMNAGAQSEQNRVWLSERGAATWTPKMVNEFITENGLSLEDWYKRYGYLEGFATGGVATPGWAMVGEDGPELVNFSSRAAVFPADVTDALMHMPAQGTDGSREAELAMMREELAEARENNRILRAMLYHLQNTDRNTKKNADIAEENAMNAESGGATAFTAAVPRMAWAKVEQ